MKLDSEQKRVLKAVLPATAGCFLVYPLCLWAFGRLDSWGDLLIYLGVGLVVTLLGTGFYVLGSKIPKKDD